MHGHLNIKYAKVQAARADALLMLVAAASSATEVVKKPFNLSDKQFN